MRNAIAFAVSLAALAGGAGATELEDLLKARKYAEAERLANTTLAADARNEDALIAKAGVIVALHQENRYDEAQKLAEQCIEAHPKSSDCQETYGNVVATKVMAGGMMAAISNAGKIRDAYRKAVELDPRNHSARSSLVEFYLLAPGIAGGGKDKAQAAVAEAAKVDPQVGRLLQGRLELQDERLAQAELTLLAAAPGSNDKLQRLQRDLLMNLGSMHVKAKHLADAERIFHEVQKRFPDSGLGHYGVAMVLQERGRPADALPLLEKAIATEQRSNFYYRLGQCWQALNDKARAVAAFEKALTLRPAPNKAVRSDIEEQLKVLKS